MRRAGGGLPRARRERFEWDRRFLADTYPSLAYAIDERAGTARADGGLPIGLPDGTIEPVVVRIEFGAGYPTFSGPAVYDAAGRWEPDFDRHIVAGGRFCLNLRGVDELDFRNQDSLPRFMADLVLFLRQQLICDVIGRFPGPAWPHGELAANALLIVESLEEVPADSRALLWDAARRGGPTRNSPCPCGSGEKLKRCHMELFKELRGVVQRTNADAGSVLRQLEYHNLKEAGGLDPSSGEGK